MDFEDILSQIGPFAKYQKLVLLVYLIPVAILSTMQSSTVHLQLRPDHWCYVPELANFSSGEQHRLTRPVIVSAVTGKMWLDSCHVYDVDYGRVGRELRLPANDTRKLAVKKCDNGWLYDRSRYWDSAVTHYDFMCDRTDGFNLISKARLIGSLVGTTIFGLIADNYGRRVSYLFVVIVSTISVISPLIIKDFTIFVIFQVIAGLAYPASLQIPFIIVIELLGATHRTKSAAYLWIGHTVGGCLHLIFTYFIPHWIWIIAINAALNLPLILAFRAMPESPLWLISAKKSEKAKQILKTIIKVNSKTVPDELLSYWLLKLELRKQRQTSHSNLFDTEVKQVCDKEESSTISRKKLIMKYIQNTLLLHMWIITTLCLVVNLITRAIFENICKIKFSDEMIFNRLFLSLVDSPAILVAYILMQSPVGRRWTNSILLLIIGVTLTSLAIVPTSYTTVTVALSILGILLTKSSLMITWTQIVEISPTRIRCLGLTSTTTVATLIVAIADYVYSQDNYVKWLPLLLFSAFSITIAFLATFVCETLNENIPQTVNSAEELITGMNYLSLAKRVSDRKCNLFITVSKWNINEIDDFGKT